LDRARGEFEAAGVGLTLIGQGSPRQAAHFRRRLGITLRVLADQQRASYHAAGAKVGDLGELLGAKVIAKGIATAIRTRQLQGRTVGNPAQLGGAMLILSDGRIAWSHLARDASDNAPPSEILRAVREAVGAAGPR
jgi:peroxiredoxin